MHPLLMILKKPFSLKLLITFIKLLDLTYILTQNIMGKMVMRIINVPIVEKY